MDPHWYAIVMAGGAGTRFWPASRRLRPKQLLPLGPRADESLIHSTVRRLRQRLAADHILIATGAHLVDATRAELPELPAGNFLAEPVPRNTAPCIAWANAVIRRRDPQAVVAVLSADHVALDEPAFQAAIEHAMNVAAAGIVTTLGIVPTRPETGYGYIEVGADRPDGACDVVRFVEKPDASTARSMVASGRFLWNAGFFFFRSAVMADAVDRHLPALGRGVRELDRAAAAGSEQDALARLFPSFDAVSIDVGVMEKLAPLAVVRASFGWSDVGSWQTAWELAPHDAQENASPDGAILVDSRRNIVANWSSSPASGKVIALVGVEDLVVVETDDALLVMPRARSQEVRKVVEELQRRHQSERL